MAKRWFIIFTVVLLLLSPFAGYADLVMGNDFLHKNEDKTDIIGKKFIINSPNGYMIPKEEPGSEKGVSTKYSYKGGSPGGREDKPYTFNSEVFVFMNGEIIYITRTYLHNGQYWGIMPHSHTYQPPGWFLMDELLMLYERKDFEEENKDNIFTYTGDYNAVLSAEQIVFHQWPGSDREKLIIDCKFEDFAIEKISADYAYKDNQERLWAYIDMKYSYRSDPSSYTDGRPDYVDRYESGWVCISDPANNDIPAFNPAPNPIPWSPDGIYNWSSSDATIWPPMSPENVPELQVSSWASGMFLVLIICLLASIVIVGAVVYMVVFEKNEEK